MRSSSPAVRTNDVTQEAVEGGNEVNEEQQNDGTSRFRPLDGEADHVRRDIAATTSQTSTHRFASLPLYRGRKTLPPENMLPFSNDTRNKDASITLRGNCYLSGTLWFVGHRPTFPLGRLLEAQGRLQE